MSARGGPACAAHRRVLDLLHDGETVPPAEAEAARSHADRCGACAAAADAAGAARERLLERAGTPTLVPVRGLRERVAARITSGEAAVLELRPFLLRAATAAAAVLVVSVSVSLWRAADHGARPEPRGPSIGREEILASIVRADPRPGR